MNNYLIGVQNSSNTERTAVHVTATGWYEAIIKAMTLHPWAFTGTVLAMNGQRFETSGKFAI